MYICLVFKLSWQGVKERYYYSVFFFNSFVSTLIFSYDFSVFRYFCAFCVFTLHLLYEMNANTAQTEERFFQNVFKNGYIVYRDLGVAHNSNKMRRKKLKKKKKK